MPDALKPKVALPSLDQVPYSVTYWPPDDMTADPVETPITQEEYQELIGKRAEAARAIPEWVNHTPEPQDCYQLGYFHNGEVGQLVCITFAEYEALKRHLATLRGHLPGKA